MPSTVLENKALPPAEEKPSYSLIERFAKELEAIGGVFIPCNNASLGQHILDILHKNSIDSIHAWEQAYLPDGLINFLQTQGIHVVDDLDSNARGGLTGALYGIAETGTLVIPGEPGRPLTASLLPDIHIAVLHAQDIRSDLTQTLSSLSSLRAPVTVLVSGPSRTADIEMTLSIGVHGPCQVIVCCLED